MKSIKGAATALCLAAMAACPLAASADEAPSKVSPGDGLTAQCTEAVAMLVEKS